MRSRRGVALSLALLLLSFGVPAGALEAGTVQVGASRRRGCTPRRQPRKRKVKRKRPGSRRRSGRKSGRKDDKKSKERYLVVRVNYRVEVVKSSKLKSFRSVALKKYQAELKSYKKALENAKKRGGTLTRPKPTLTFKVLTQKGFTSEKAAKAYRDKAQAALNKAKKKRDAKKS